MQWYEFLTEQEVAQVHETSMQILATVGIDFRYEPALKVLKKGGARVEGERVFFPGRLVDEQIGKVPAEFTLYARDSDDDVAIGGEHLTFAPGYGATFVTDLHHGRRDGTLRDFKNFVKLTDASPHQDICSGMVIEPSDVPHEIRHARAIYTTIKYSTKPFMGSAMGVQGARDSIQLASILFGDQNQLSQKPRMISILCSLTPLVYDERMLGAIMEYARAGQPQLISSLAIAGATSPVTLPGTLAVQNAEVLAGIVLTQLIREGTPVVFAGASSSTDMRTGALTIGSPEMALNTAATAQMARFYGLPVRSGGAICDAKSPDAQAAGESMMSLMMAQVSGINFVLHSAGILESYNCISYEKFIIDDELCGMVKRIKQGYEVSADRVAMEVIREVGPGGHYLDKDHTFDYFRNEFYQPHLFHRDDFVSWQRNGSPRCMETAHKRVKEILESHEAPELSADVDRDLKKFLEKLN
jgi:trimethylamine--corrinoid protein Co-methyltransferase